MVQLKPFEIAVKEGHAKAVMSSYNYLGTQWAGACSSLSNTVLRDEWGYTGFVMTDYFGNFGYMQGARSIYNGGDSCLATYDTGSNYVADTSNGTAVSNMRRASHNILYTVVNSRAYEPENIRTGLLVWQIALIAADIVLAALLILLEAMSVRKFLKRRVEQKTQAVTTEDSDNK